MAPIEYANLAQAESAVRDTIQSLYNVMLHTANYDATGTHTTLDALVREVGVLSQALRDVNTATDGAAAAGGSAKLPSVPRDLVQYVEDGRNPDIYTREFVELVRKTNQIRAGKQAAFAQFQTVLAGQIRMALPELSGDVDRVVAATGGAANAAAAAVSTLTPLGASATATANTNTSANAAATAMARNTDSSSSRDGTPGVLTPGGSTPGPNAAGAGGVAAAGPTAAAAAAGVSSVDMMGILPSTPQPGTGAAGSAPAGGPAAGQDTQMS